MHQKRNFRKFSQLGGLSVGHRSVLQAQPACSLLVLHRELLVNSKH